MKLADVPTVIAVASGKGGVGKTTCASDIARAARDVGYNVGLIDADISTPNSPEVVGGEGQDLSDQRLASHDAIVPPKVNGIQLVSQGVVLPDDVPVLRDGTWRAEAVADYIENVEWEDETDVVVIDTPPGTGEELQVIASAAPPDFGFIITTPHPSSVRDATKTHEFFKQADIDHGVVLNMAYIPGEDVASHVLDGADLTDIDNIGEKKDEAIRDLLTDNSEDYAMFGHDLGDGVDVEADLMATIPYTEDFENRRPHYEGAIEDVFAQRGVEV